jgi:hypothetical protein
MNVHKALTKTGDSIKSNEVLYEIKEEKKEQKVWKSCCLELSPQGVAYFGQFLTTGFVLSISTYFLIQADGDCNKSSPYIGLISFVMGKILSSVISSV